MKPDQKRVSALLVQTVSLLCKNGLHFEKGLRIQGLLGITIDDSDVFIVQIDDKLLQKNTSEEQANLVKRKSRSDHDTVSRVTPKDLSQQFLEVTPVKIPKCHDPPASDGHMSDENNMEQICTEENDASKPLGVDDEIIYVKSELTEDLIENTEPPGMELVPHVGGEGQKPFDDQMSGVEGFDGGADDFRNENFDMIHVQRRNFPQVGDFMMQQQFANGPTPAVGPPSVFDGRCSTFKDQSTSSFNETFHHLSGTQEMIKESWTFTKYKEMTRHPGKGQVVASGNANALVYSKSQSNSGGDKPGGIFGNSVELVPSTSPRRRSNIKTVVCQYPDCGKTFCHSCHLYRHQRLKHGRRFGVVAQTSFTCQFPSCGKIFYRKASLINHNFAVHALGPRPPSPVVGDDGDVNISF